jgi:hypothetical protein
MSARVNADELATKVKEMYRHVAEKPHASYHFELGRQLAVRLGYAVDILDRIPAERWSPSPASATSSTLPASARATL